MCFKIIHSNQREVQTDNIQKFPYCMVCVSYKKNTTKWNRVKFKHTYPRSSTTSRSAKNSTSKTEWGSNRHAREVQLLHVMRFHSQWRQKSWSRHFSNLLQNDRNIIYVSSSPRSKKVKKYCQRGLYKKSIICVTLTKWMRNLQRKIHHRSSTWKQQEVWLL